MRRKKKVGNAALSEEEKRLWGLASADCMTDEETDEEDPNAFIMHKLPWRTDQMDMIIAKIDAVDSNNGANAHKIRRIGEATMRLPASILDREIIIIEE